jgi:hypothetical protein
MSDEIENHVSGRFVFLGPPQPSALILHPSLQTGQEGLEPPTDGFGDRYSTN